MKSKRKSDINLSRDTIVFAAIAIADKDGLPGLTMRKLAEALGVEAMSLYYHIRNKKELIVQMVDAVVPSIPRLDSCIDWKDALRKRADLMRAVLMQHPWAAHEFVAGMNVGPNMLQYIDTTTGYFLTAGFSYKLTDYAWNVIDSYIYGFNLQSQNFPVQPSEYKKAAQQFLPMIPKDTYPHMHTMAQVIIRGEYNGIQDFNFGLELILGSLERLLQDIK